MASHVQEPQYLATALNVRADAAAGREAPSQARHEGARRRPGRAPGDAVGDEEVLLLCVVREAEAPRPIELAHLQ